MFYNLVWYCRSISSSRPTQINYASHRQPNATKQRWLKECVLRERFECLSWKNTVHSLDDTQQGYWHSKTFIKSSRTLIAGSDKGRDDADAIGTS